MKIPFKELMVQSCFIDNKGEMRKKVAENKATIVKDSGKVSTRKVKAEAEFEPSICDLRFLGVGLRRHPEVVVEIGDGNPFRKKRKS